jgi:GTP-binding protein
MKSPKPEPPRIASASFVASAPEARLLPAPTTVEIAFAGRSNVGKSTLLNALMERKGLARTSSTPGCTRELVSFEVKTPDGAVLSFVDLPGYGYAKRSKTERAAWAGFIEDYLLTRASLAAVVLLFDVRRGLEEDDQGLIDLMASPAKVSRREVPVILVATKLDKLVGAARKPALERLNHEIKRKVIGFAESDRKTHADLWREVRKLAGVSPPAVASSDQTQL